MNTNIDDFYALPQSSDMKWETILTRLISVPRTRADLERRLRERGCPREAADELLDRYEQAGLIDDRGYAVLYVDSKRDFGILRVIVNKPDETEKLLKANEWTYKIADVIGVKLPDRPGGVAEVLEAIHEAGVNVEYMYAFVNRIPGRADTVFRGDDIETTLKALTAKGIEILSPEEAYNG